MGAVSCIQVRIFMMDLLLHFCFNISGDSWNRTGNNRAESTGKIYKKYECNNNMSLIEDDY